eukprot:m.45722 g.45722  ORF g.45722 m.45722 type:complete len:268 (-) comp13100_c0_seq1:1121-1924(-)
MALMQTFESASRALNEAHQLSLSNAQQLELYGLYKQALIGSCNVSKPAFYDFRGRAKWQAWHDLGELPSSSAAERYIALVTTHLPTWHLEACQQSSSSSEYGSQDESSGDKTDDERSLDDDSDDSRHETPSEHQTAIALGPVVSRPTKPDDIATDDKTLFDYAEEGEIQAIVDQLSHLDVNAQDSEGETLLHKASDRGHLELVETLLQHGADVHAQDSSGCTPLHSAAYCEHGAIADRLLAAGALADTPDVEGASARSIAPQLFEGR